MAKTKVSRPVLWAVGLAVAGYIAFTLSGQSDSTPPVKPRILTARAASAEMGADPGITDADRKAHFAPYASTKKDAFLPHVTTATTLTVGGPGGTSLRGTWILTGITEVNGHQSALLENPTTGESQYLITGDGWHDHRVVAVGSDAIVLVNKLGQRLELTFPTPDNPTGDETSPKQEASGTAEPAGNRELTQTLQQLQQTLQQQRSVPPVTFPAPPQNTNGGNNGNGEGQPGAYPYGNPYNGGGFPGNGGFPNGGFPNGGGFPQQNPGGG